MLDIIPKKVVTQIQKHLRESCIRAEKGWESAHADEDALTGDLGATLRTTWITVSNITSDDWRWRLTYTKFRGRGRGAEEKKIGADGIFQIEVESVPTGVMNSKGLLFQAKKHDDRGKKRLVKQAEAMESLVPNSSAIFIYGPESYDAFSSRDILPDFGKQRVSSTTSMGDFLANTFVPCKAGVRGMFYDSVRHALISPHATKGSLLIRKQLGHRFRIEVQEL